jgi:hypothetical protein
VIIPDGVVPIVAWRYWKLGTGGLTSVNVGTGYWPACRAFEAECRALGWATPPLLHGAPCEACSCGIYGAIDLDTLKTLVHPAPVFPFAPNHVVVGEVYLWGKVIPGERGYRAQFAYPKRLFVVPGRDDAWCSFAVPALGAAYRVPVESMPRRDAIGQDPALRSARVVAGVMSRAATRAVQDFTDVVRDERVRERYREVRDRMRQQYGRWKET